MDLFISSYRLSVFSQQCLADLETKYSGLLTFRRGVAKGTLQLYASLPERNSQYKLLSKVVKHLEKISADEVSKFDPILQDPCLFPGGSIFSDEDRSVDVHSLCLALRTVAESLGVKVITGKRVQTLKSDSQPLKGKSALVQSALLSDGSTLQSDIFIVANGNHSPEFASWAGDGWHSWPVRGFVLEVPLQEQQQPLSVNVVDDLRRVYVSPISSSSVRLSGYCEFGPALPDKSLPVDFSIAQTLLRQAKALLPPGYLTSSPLYEVACAGTTSRSADGRRSGSNSSHPVGAAHPAAAAPITCGESSFTRTVSADTTLMHSCWRPQTADDLPVLGQSGSYGNLYYNTGHGHLGLTRAVGSSRLLVDMISATATTISGIGVDRSTSSNADFSCESSRLRSNLDGIGHAHGIEMAAFSPTRFKSLTTYIGVVKQLIKKIR